jgi:hypothetical protein
MIGSCSFISFSKLFGSMMNCNRNSQTVTNLISQEYNSWISFGAAGILYHLFIQNALVLIHMYLKEEIISALSNARIHFAAVESFFRS